MKYASENNEAALINIGINSKANFIENLGNLLAQTKKDVKTCIYTTKYKDATGEFVLIIYNDDRIKPINIDTNEYIDIMYDVIVSI